MNPLLRAINTSNAPKPLGTYSQAVVIGTTVYLSGQIPLDPSTRQLVTGNFRDQLCRVFDNLQAVANAAGGSLANAIKLNVYLTDPNHFPVLNEVMPAYFCLPYPARTMIAVSVLPLGAAVEIDVLLELT